MKKNKKEKETKRCKNNLDTRERAIRVRRGGLSDKCVLWVMKSRWGAFVPSTTTYWSCISVYTLTRFQRSDRENRGNEGDGKRMTGDRQTDRGNTGRRNLSCENTNGYINATWKDIRSRERTGRIVDNNQWSLGIRWFKDESQLFRSFKSLHLFIKLMYMMYLLFCGSLIQSLDKYWRRRNSRMSVKYWWRAIEDYKYFQNLKKNWEKAVWNYCFNLNALKIKIFIIHSELSESFFNFWVNHPLLLQDFQFNLWIQIVRIK